MSVSTLKPRRLSESNDVQSFNCGTNTWDMNVSGFLKEDALFQQNKGMNVTILFYSDSQLVAFVSLTASQITIDKRSPWRKWFGLEGIPYKNVPCVLVAQFGVEQSMQRQGIGHYMLSWVRGVTQDIDVGARFLTLHVENNNKEGRSFWESQEFIVFEDANTKNHTFMLHDLYSVSLYTK